MSARLLRVRRLHEGLFPAALALLAVLLCPSLARAHRGAIVAVHVDVRPNGELSLQPIGASQALVALEFPPSCTDSQGLRGPIVDLSRAGTRTIVCADSLAGQTIAISGLGAHATAVVVRFSGQLEGTVTVYAESPTLRLAGSASARFEATGPFVSGAAHVARGLDHLALVGLLVIAARRLRDSLLPLLGFTVAHATTLGLAAFGHVLMPSRLAELLVAASLVLATRLRADEPIARKVVTAFAFGLVHGVAFLEGAAPLLEASAYPLRTLAAFHLGIECVQLGVALGFAQLLRVFRERTGDDDRARSVVGVLAGAYGVALFLARAT